MTCWVSVKLNDIDRGLKTLRRKMQREGVFRELRKRRHYEKPSARKVSKRKEAQKRRSNSRNSR